MKKTETRVTEEAEVKREKKSKENERKKERKEPLLLRLEVVE